ncbi:MAG: ABC transporter permease [Halobacteriota archaeon]
MVYDALFDTWDLFVRAMKKLLRTPILIFLSLFQALLFLFLFTQIFSKFGGLPGFPAGGYLQFATAGILLFPAMTASTQSGNSMVDDINSGYLSKMLVTPVSRPAILLGRLLSDGVMTIIPTGIILVLAYLLGATFATGVPGILLIFFTLAFFEIAWSGIGLAAGLATKSQETVTGLGALILIPLMFMSTALVPLQFLPDWIQTVSNFNPISYTANAVRALMSTGFDWNTIIAAYAVLALVAAVTMGATLYQFRRVVK